MGNFYELYDIIIAAQVPVYDIAGQLEIGAVYLARYHSENPKDWYIEGPSLKSALRYLVCATPASPDQSSRIGGPHFLLDGVPVPKEEILDQFIVARGNYCDVLPRFTEQVIYMATRIISRFGYSLQGLNMWEPYGGWDEWLVEERQNTLGTDEAARRLHAINRIPTEQLQRIVREAYKERKNNLLTLAELKGMVGKPVWLKTEELSYYDVLNSIYDDGMAQFYTTKLNFCRYGKTWFAYRRKPEEGTP